MDDELAFLSARDLLARFARGDLSPVEAAAAAAARIEALDPGLNALTTPTPELAAEQARASERRHRRGEALALDGVPVVVKDLFDTAGVRTTYGSSIFADHVPAADAVAVRRLREAGAVIVGKGATHEFAWGITTDNPHFGPTRNPWAPDRVAGGSSGGNGAALAAGFAPLAVGSDTAGSIRIPAAFCGVVGLKPTYASVDATGAFPLAPSLDHVGPMARTADDAALLLSVLTGTGATGDAPAGDLEGLTVGVCPDLDQAGLSEDARCARDEVAAVLERLGARVAEVDFAGAPPVFELLGANAMPEASFVHRTAGLWPARRDEYGADVRARLEAAERLGLDDYLRAAEGRRRLTTGLRELLRAVDVLLTPVSATPPARVGEETASFRELVITSTAPQNLSGLPAIAVRAGFGADGIPVGMQLTGPPAGEPLVVRVATALEAATPELHGRRPPLARA